MPNSFLQEQPARPGRKDNLFVWTVFLLVLSALVFACWLGSFYVFGHPEHPKAYRLLQKLGKISPPTRFALTKAPPGEFLEARRVFERYSKYTSLQMTRENELLFRNYLRNYSETKKLVPYLTGKYLILRSYELQRNDLFNSGVVVLTQSSDFPQLLAEIVYPAAKENIPDLLSILQPGLEIRLQRTMDLSAVVQVCHALDGRLQLSVVPLLYGSYALKNGVGTFSLEPPQSLNVAAGFPLVRGEEVRSVVRENLKRRTVAKMAASSHSDSPDQIVRVEEPASPSAPAGASAVGREAPPLGQDTAAARPVSQTSTPDTLASIPRVEVVAPPKEGSKTVSGQVALEKQPASNPSFSGDSGATAQQKDTVTKESSAAAASLKNGKPVDPGQAIPKGRPDATVAAPPVAGISQVTAAKTPPKSEVPTAKPDAATGKPDPAALARQSAAAAKVPPTNNAPGGLPLKPFIAAAPAPSVTQPTGNWKTYGAGTQPSGKSVTADQATSLQGRNDGAPMYLHGQFTVTAAGNNRAVLRQASGGDAKNPARVIVEYPAGAVPPRQGSSVARSDGRGFEIREVRRTPDGQVNIYVREVSGQ
jgi:hypothetical protein